MTMRHLPLLRERQKHFSFDWLCKIFLGPIVTEKAYRNAEHRIYSVKVHPDATKVSIAAAFKSLFDIKPDAINIAVIKGKTKRRRTGKQKEVMITRPKAKKAMIRIPAGVNFDFAA